MEFKTLKNLTAIPQQIVYRGRQYVIAPKAEENYSVDVAGEFLSKCGVALQDTTDQFGSMYEMPDDQRKYMYLANVTGNPDAPEKIKVQQYNEKNQPITVEIDNPARVQHDLKWEIQLGHKQYIGEGGIRYQMSRGKKVVNLPAGRRIKVEKEIGEQVLIRASRSNYPVVIRSREETPFEPNMTWELDDIRTYLRQIDPLAKLENDSQQHLVQEVKDKNLSNADAAQLLRKWKQHLLRRVYFRIVDPRYRLPTKAEFDELTTGKSVDQVAEEEVKKLLAEADLNSKKGIKKLQPVAQ